MLLSDEEIEGLKAEYEQILELEWHPTVFYLLEALAKVQLKKVVEWGNESCPHTQESTDTSNDYQSLNLTPLKKHECPECWQSLLREID